MQTNRENQTKENVVSLFGPKPKDTGTNAEKEVDNEDRSFDAELKRNKDVADKLRRERQKANQAVLRSYRLKT